MADDYSTETFQGLMLRFRGRTGLTQRELAGRMGVHVRSVQAWESGLSYPTASSLELLIAAYVDERGFQAGHEVVEAAAFWAAALRQAPRLRPPFETAWFANLLAQRSSSPVAVAPAALAAAEPPPPAPDWTTALPRRIDWGEAPHSTDFVGRDQELSTLGRWVLDDNCRLVVVLGVGGIGKTRLTARLARDLAPRFARTYWRSLRNAPSATEWLGGAISFLSGQVLVPPEGEAARVGALLELLRAQRCLLILDNLETLLEPGQRDGRYRDDVGGYGELLRVVGQSEHQSCVIVTSREAPVELAELDGERGGVRVFELSGLGASETEALLSDKRLLGDVAAWAGLSARYGGNCLALRMVGQSVQQVFGGEIATFLDQSAIGSGLVYGGIRRLLDTQLSRLSAQEQDVLRWLAVERDPVTFTELAADLDALGRAVLVEVVEALRRRSLVERTERGSAFTLQSVVLEHVTDALVEAVAYEIEHAALRLLVSHALLKAQSKDYLRRTQERLIITPVLERLTVTYDSARGAEHRLIEVMEQVRRSPQREHGYAPGNLVNLLRVLRGDLRGLDLSHLSIRQAYLQEVQAQDASLAAVHLAESVLAAAFNHPTAIGVSADGSYLCIGTSTGDLQLWRVRDRVLLVSVQAHAGGLWGAALSRDGQLVASGGEDGAVKLWELPGGRLHSVLPGHIGGAYGVALSEDSRLLVSGGFDGTLKLWDVPRGQLLAALEGHTGSIYGVAASSDGRLVASGGEDGTVRLWDGASGQLLAGLDGHTDVVRGVALSDDGRLLVSGGLDATVSLWSTGDGRLLTTLRGHTGGVWYVALSPDGKLVASGSFDGTVKLWEASSGRLLMTLAGHSGAISGVAVSADHLVASGSWDGTSKLWEAQSGRLLATLQGYTNGVMCVALSGDNQLLVNGSIDGTVNVWDAAHGRLITSLRGHTGAVWGVALSDDGQLAASASWDRTVRLWHPQSGRLLATLQGHDGIVQGVALSRDGLLVASGSQDGTLKVWDTHSSRLLMTLDGHIGGAWSVALSGDRRLLASGGQDGTLKLWDTGSGRLLMMLEGHTATVRCVALSGDGRLVASGSWDRTIKLWDTSTGRLLNTLQGHHGTVEGVALNRDGGLVVSSSWDGTVKIWDAHNGREQATLQGHESAVFGVALSSDGRLVASGSWDRTIRLWQVSTGATLHTLRSDGPYERMDITGLTGVTEAQRAGMLALGAVVQQ